MASQAELKKRLQVLMKKPENQVCSDCPERQPRWASLVVAPPGSPHGALPIGAFCCLECSGSHRRLGVHISFVRSVNLDSWKEREVMAMENGGNAKINKIFEARLFSGDKPTATADGRTRERFIRDKYERRKYFDPTALQQFYSNDEEEDDDDEEEQQDAPKTNASQSRAPSDAAKKRAEKRRGRLAATRAKTTSPKKEAKPVSVPAPAPAPEEPVVDLLDFGAIPTQTDPGPPPPPPSAPATPYVANEVCSAANVNNVVHDPFAVVSESSSVEVSVKSVTTTALPGGNKPVPQQQQKEKPKLNSDDIMKMFNAPPQGQPQFGMAGGMNPAMMGMAMNNPAGMMNAMGPGAAGEVASSLGATMAGGNAFLGAAPTGGNGNIIGSSGATQMSGNTTNMMMQQMNPGMPNMMMQQQYKANYTMQHMQQMQQPGNHEMMQQNMKMMMQMQQQLQQMQLTGGAPQQQMMGNNFTGMTPMGGNMQQNANMNGTNMSHIAMMNRLQMGNAPNMMAATSNREEDNKQQGQQQFGQFGMNGFGP